MDEKEKEAAAQAITEEAAAKAKAEAEANAAVDALAARDAEIAKLKEDRDNYRNVALKRLGKLPGDAGFLEGADEKTGLTVEEQVKKTLLEREIAKAEADKETENRRLAKENAELRLALKNRPGASLGGDSGTSTEVKDNVFSEAQLADLRKRAERLKADPEKFIEAAKRNLSNRR